MDKKLNLYEEVMNSFEKRRTEAIDRRQEYNLKIVELLGEFFEANPQLRFEQGLYVLLNDYTKFSRESKETLLIIEHYKERNKKHFKANKENE